MQQILSNLKTWWHNVYASNKTPLALGVVYFPITYAAYCYSPIFVMVYVCGLLFSLTMLKIWLKWRTNNVE